MSRLLSASTLKRLDATVGNALCRLIGWVRHVLRRPELAEDPLPTDVRSILILRPGGIGDMLMLVPIIQAVAHAYPAARVDVVCERRNSEVLALAGLRCGVILYDAHPWRILLLHRMGYDVVLDTEQFHHFSAIMAWLSSAPVRVGFNINPVRLHLYTHLVGYSIDGYEMAQFSRLLRPLGIPLTQRSLHGALAGCSSEWRTRFPDPIADLASKRVLVAISPGSSNPYKQWGTTRLIRLVQALQNDDIGVVLVGGAAEREQAKLLLRQVRPDLLVDCVGSCSLQQTAVAILACATFVGGDSGLGHLAVALGKPTVLLFGPSDYRKWGHSGSGHRVIHHELPCSPCSIFGYHKLCRTVPCMASIQVSEVMDAIKQQLANMPRSQACDRAIDE